MSAGSVFTDFAMPCTWYLSKQNTGRLGKESVLAGRFVRYSLLWKGKTGSFLTGFTAWNGTPRRRSNSRVQNVTEKNGWILNYRDWGRPAGQGLSSPKIGTPDHSTDPCGLVLWLIRLPDSILEEKNKGISDLSRCEIPFPGRILFPAKNRGEGRASGAFTQPRSWKSERPDTGGPIPNWEITRGATANRFLVPCAGHFAKILPWTHFFCLSLFRHIFKGMWILILRLLMIRKQTEIIKVSSSSPSSPSILLSDPFLFFLMGFSYFHSEIESRFPYASSLWTIFSSFNETTLFLENSSTDFLPFLLKRKRIVLDGAYSTEKDPFHGFPIFESSQ